MPSHGCVERGFAVPITSTSGDQQLLMCSHTLSFLFQLVLCMVSVGHAAKPNILFVLTDDQRADTLHCAGNDRIHTPNRLRLWEGWRFFRKYSRW